MMRVIQCSPVISGSVKKASFVPKIAAPYFHPQNNCRLDRERRHNQQSASVEIRICANAICEPHTHTMCANGINDGDLHVT
jgi:hypothetical protein